MKPSLISCPACGNSVSRTAAACPGCGHGIKKPYVTRLTVFLLIAALGLLMLAEYVGSKRKAERLRIEETQENFQRAARNLFR